VVRLLLLTAAMGEALTEAERATFTALTGGRLQEPLRVEELVCVVGRRGGQSRAMAVLAAYPPRPPPPQIFCASQAGPAVACWARSSEATARTARAAACVSARKGVRKLGASGYQRFGVKQAAADDRY
jgi:hypothetical protein